MRASCVVLALGFALAPAWGQPAAPALVTVATATGQNGEELTAQWTPVESSVEEINVVQGKSVRVVLSGPTSRVYVADEGILSVQVLTPTELLLGGTQPGPTQLMVWGEGGAQLVFNVNVEPDLERLRRALEHIAPGSEVKVTSYRGTIFLGGNVRNSAAAERVMQVASVFAGSGGTGSDPVQNHMTIAGEHQVLLRVTIAEMSRQATRALGINGYLAGDNFQDVFVLNNIGGINPANIGAVDGASATGPIPFAIGGGGIAVGQATTLSLGFPRVQMQVFLQALRENGLSRTLAEPNLITLSGHEAEFLAGGRFPVPVPQGGAGGSTSITIQYEEFGARLRFLPVVLGGNRIRITVTPEVSELDFTSAVNLSGFVVPGLTQRSATTTVELASGQTIVIAGLLRDEVRANSTKIPWLGDIPILGSLFRSVRYQRNQTDLVVMVTPEIVAPLNPDQVPPVPGEGLVDPTDWELFGLALLQGGESPFSNGVFPPEAPVPTGVDGLALPGAAPAGAVQGPFGPSSQLPRFPGGRGLARPPGPLFGPWGPASLADESAELAAMR